MLLFFAYHEWEMRQLGKRLEIDEAQEANLRVKLENLHQQVEANAQEFITKLKESRVQKGKPISHQDYQLFTSKCTARDLSEFSKFVIVTRAKQDATWLLKTGLAKPSLCYYPP